MTDETPARRGDAAWKEQRERIARRNADAHKRALDAQRSRAALVAASARENLDRESQLLRDLNARISKQQARGVR